MIRGVVALEFLLLFPFMLAMLYASAVYGITFFAKYKMQNAVDRAVAAALYVDRSRYSAADLGSAVKDRANNALNEMIDALPAWNGEREGNCQSDSDGGIEMMMCSLTYKEYSTHPVVPALHFGMLGSFPPLPDELKVEARVAY